MSIYTLFTYYLLVNRIPYKCCMIFGPMSTMYEGSGFEEPVMSDGHRFQHGVIQKVFQLAYSITLKL